jgi:hypothetical protein
MPLVHCLTCNATYLKVSYIRQCFFLHLYTSFRTLHHMFWPILVIISCSKLLLKTTVLLFCGSNVWYVVPYTSLCILWCWTALLLCCVVLCCVVLCCVVLCCVVLFCSVLFCSVLFCSVVLCCVVLCCVVCLDSMLNNWWWWWQSKHVVQCTENLLLKKMQCVM